HGIDYDFALARYQPDGSPDAGFAANGTTPTNFATMPNTDDCETAVPPFQNLPRDYQGDPPLTRRDDAAAIVLQPDGKMIVAGTADYALALARYNPDGQLDMSFGAGGKVTTRLGSHPKAPDLVSTLALQPDGKIVVTGGANLIPEGALSFFLLRY